MEKLDFENVTNKILKDSKTNSEQFEEYKNEVFNKIKNDSEVYELLKKKGLDDDLIKSNLGKCDDFYKNHYAIKNIKTYKDCVSNNIFYEIDLVIEDETVELKRIALAPYREYLAYKTCFIRYRDFDDSFYDVTYKKISDIPDTIKGALGTINKPKKFVYIYGATRTGKTYTAIRYINYVLKKKNYEARVDFVDCGKRFDEITSLLFSKFNSDKEELNNILEDFKNDDILVFDDFGSESRVAQFRQSFLIPVLKARAKENKTTIFTSIYKPEEIVKSYKIKAGDDILVKELQQILVSNSIVLETCQKPNLY